jgi:hypothetical protein
MAKKKGGSSSRRQKRFQLKKQEQNVTGIDRVAKKIENAFKSEIGISGLVYASKGDGEFAGNMIGDPVVIAQTLYSAGKNNKALFTIMDEVVKTLKREGFWQEVAEEEDLSGVAVSYLRDIGRIKPRLYNILDRYGIIHLRDLEGISKSETERWTGFGKMMYEQLRDVMNEYKVRFKNERANWKDGGTVSGTMEVVR